MYIVRKIFEIEVYITEDEMSDYSYLAAFSMNFVQILNFNKKQAKPTQNH
jgi:hypothetical protein